MTGVVYTVLPVYILYRYRFAQGTVVPGNLQAYSLHMHWIISTISESVRTEPVRSDPVRVDPVQTDFGRTEPVRSLLIPNKH